MKSLNIMLSVALLGSVALAAPGAGTDPVAQVTGGQIKGRILAGGVAAFKGIPFAQPPVGDLRWRDPAPVKAWSGVRDAGTMSFSCTQESANFNRQEAAGSQEDCLYLNVWTSEWPAGKSPKPVMVWLYGGGNFAGGANVDYMDGASLAKRGVVMVTINYRLGVFGFYSHPGLTAESSHHSSGNYGLLDQVAALKWVRDNIAKFGGDPKTVTLFGQSAGAIDTSMLVASPLSKGLIFRSIQESGPPVRPTHTMAEAEQLGVKFAASLKAPEGADAMKFLRSLSGPELQKATVAAGRKNGGPEMNPIIDGYLMPKYPALAYQEGKELAIPMIVGNNAREQARAYKGEAMTRVLKDNYGSLAPKAEAFYGVANGAAGNNDPLYGPASTQVVADTRHRCPAIAEALWRSDHGRTTYEFQFDPPVAGEAFTRHQAEIPFVFGNLLNTGFLSGPYTEADRKISGDIQQYWVNFARTGNPNGPGLPAWPKFDPKTRPYLEFTLHDGPVAREALRHEICELYFEALKETIPGGTAASQ